MPATIQLEEKATIHHADKIQKACLEALRTDEPLVEINWAGCMGIDTCVLQLLLALSREKQVHGTGELTEAVRETLAAAAFDSNLKPILYPE